MKKHIVFDFDDTITSAYELNQQLFVDTFTPHDPNIDQDFLRKLHFEKKGGSMILQFQEAIDKFGLKLSAEQLLQENAVLHKKRAREMNIFEGVYDLLRHFKSKGKVISICTNREGASLKIILKKHKLFKYLDNVVSCLDEQHEKPDPYCLVELMDKYPNITKGETVYFGDSKTDMEFATKADIDFVIIDHYLNKKIFYQLILESFADSEDLNSIKR